VICSLKLSGKEEEEGDISPMGPKRRINLQKTTVERLFCEGFERIFGVF